MLAHRVNARYLISVFFSRRPTSCVACSCPYLHRVAGDVERRYHLRYYKTAMCVYETDPRGYCVKNGAHCAYSHGPDDLRQPVFDAHTDPSSNTSSSQSALSESLDSMKVGSMDSGSGLGSPRPRSYSGSSVRSDKSSAFEDTRWHGELN